MRSYNERTLSLLTETYAVENPFGGAAIHVRPVPGGSGRGTLDVRVLERARRRLAGDEDPGACDDVLAARAAAHKPHRRLDEGDELIESHVLMRLRDREIPVVVISPATQEGPRPALLYLHGGGFIAGSAADYVDHVRLISQACGCVGFVPEYRLAPEAPFPAAVDDACDAFSWVIGHAVEWGVDTTRIVLAGDSAGASLCNAVVVSRPSNVAPAMLFELYPLVDASRDDSYWSEDAYQPADGERDEAMSRVLRMRDKVEAVRRLYLCCGGDPEDVRISPLRHRDDLGLFPPTTIVTSEFDYLRVQGELFASLLHESGVSVESIGYAGMDHGFFDYLGTWPQAEDACRLLAERIGAL